eukprot:SM000125S26099  [mRNA]  locus=s125:384142:392192:+ [translate_table: standard]
MVDGDVATAPGGGGDAVVVKSEEDRRLYRVVELPNGLAAVLVHDPEAVTAAAAGQGRPLRRPARSSRQAAAAMAVGVGSFSDPPVAQGLAHFLEHMLFMGSAKYPDENDYDAYLAEHGGSSNAFTDTEVTCYHFDVNPKFLQPALDRFAQFFIAPLAKPEAMDREVQAVDSEFNQVQQSDSARLLQLQCHTAHADHPFHKFSWGNRKSLVDDPAAVGVDMRGELMGLYGRHYNAGSMRLAVIGGEPLDVLEAWVRELFGDVKGPGGPRPLLSLGACPPLWEAGKLYRVDSVKDQHLLALAWPLPCLDWAYTRKPADYISHLVGHEGEGSLLALLKQERLASSLSAGVGEGGYERNSGLYIFSVHIALTEQGLQDVMTVVGLVHQYLAMLRREGPQEWVFRELGAMSAMEFRYHEEEAPDDYTVRLATNMFVYPKEHVVAGDYLFTDWDSALVSDTLARLVPENLRLDLVTRGATSASTATGPVLVEPWFEVPYALEAVQPEVMRDWAEPPSLQAALRMPPSNEFIPSDFSLRCSDTSVTATQKDSLLPGHADGNGQPSATADEAAADEPPVVILEDGGCRLWHKLDRVFRTPRANVFFAITSPAADTSASAAVCTELFVRLVEDSLSKTMYLANVAKLESSLTVAGHRIEVKLHGFSHKLPQLAESIFRRLDGFIVDPERFEVVREELARAYRNANMKPMKQSAYLRLAVLRQTAWLIEDKLAALLELTPTDLQAFLPRLLEQVLLASPTFLAALVRVVKGSGILDKRRCSKLTFVEVLAHGNLLEDEARTLCAVARKHLPPGSGLERADVPEDAILELPAGRGIILNEAVKNKSEDNSVVEVYFQGLADMGAGSVRDKSLLDLMEQVAYEPCYDQLRTKEQLGYRVDCGVRNTHRIFGFCFHIQSAEYDCIHLHSRVEAFLGTFRETLVGMSADTFESHREALIQQKLQKDHSLLDESDRHWDQIWEHRYFFNSRKVEAAALENVTLAELVEWYDKYLAVGSATRRKLTVHVWSRGKPMHDGPGSDIVATTPAEAKQSLPVLPRRPISLP